MSMHNFKPHHMSITPDDVAGNDGLGRYILLPGSDGRAARISEHFTDRFVREHSRRHNFYGGRIDSGSGPIDIAVVSTGMGCPSVDIIVNELIKVGARRLIRVGTAGSLQVGRIPIGSVVVASSAVRDEGTTRHYMPPEIPAVASAAMVEAGLRACRALDVRSFSGTVHTKDSLFARELSAGPRVAENERFMEQLTAAGVLCSEMESAMLFTLAQIYNQQDASGYGVEGGAILGIIGDEEAFGTEQQIADTTETAVRVGLETVRQRAAAERAG